MWGSFTPAGGGNHQTPEHQRGGWCGGEPPPGGATPAMGMAAESGVDLLDGCGEGNAGEDQHDHVGDVTSGVDSNFGHHGEAFALV